MRITSKANLESDVKVKFLTKKKLEKDPKKSLEYTGFKGKSGQTAVVGNVLYVGTTGTKKSDDWRILGFGVAKKLKSMEARSVGIKVPFQADNGLDYTEEFMEGLLLGDYSFTDYKSEPKKEKDISVNVLMKDDTLLDESFIKNVVSKINAQNKVRDLVNKTPEDANSETIENHVVLSFMGQDNFDVTIYREEDLKRLGMEGHLAVNRASRHQAKTIKITYTPEDTYINHHVFVGKGLTYDSGGLSIKPSNHMTNMKSDKAGAMTLIGLMHYLKDHGSIHKVTCYLGIAENMIDGTAYKPDDVLTMKNGKTVHIKNTDAEGRLVLFDNLCLAEEECSDLATIHTLATLTGSAVMQFGNEACGLVGFNNKLKKQVKVAGKEAGEIFINAEFHKYMMEGVNDELADLTNTGTPNMGCQKAGLFLTNAITKENKKKYVHWDIAGTAFADKPWGSNPAGGTGFGVRTLINFLGV